MKFNFDVRVFSNIVFFAHEQFFFRFILNIDIFFSFLKIDFEKKNFVFARFVNFRLLKRKK